MKYNAWYKYPNEKDVLINTCNTREEAIDACVEYRNGDYCLDNKEERIKSLTLRDFCILGCGPGELSIEVVED